MDLRDLFSPYFDFIPTLKLILKKLLTLVLNGYKIKIVQKNMYFNMGISLIQSTKNMY